VAQRPRVVIVGGGFGGLYAAKSCRGVPVDVTLSAKENYHLFFPLLYQVAIAGLSPGNIAVPLREIFSQVKNIRTLMGEVTALDVEHRQVIYSGGQLPYDALIIATGSDYQYFGHDHWRPYAPSLDGLQSALAIRQRLLAAYEQAEQEPDPVRRQTLPSLPTSRSRPAGRSSSSGSPYVRAPKWWGLLTPRCWSNRRRGPRSTSPVPQPCGRQGSTPQG
jgi:NADH:quinone reductase (non-electrogenic)